MRTMTGIIHATTVIMLMPPAVVAGHAADSSSVPIEVVTIIAQGPPPFPAPPFPPPGPPPRGREMPGGPGRWWKDSEIVKRLQLSESQLGRIEQTYTDHRLRLVDLRADLEKQELRLRPLLDSDPPDEGKIAAQIDGVTAARGRLEKEFALMLLAIRRVLTGDQWKQLQAVQREREPRGHAGVPLYPPAAPPAYPPPPATFPPR
jgi:periplasmic protein CpxP/Spy